MPRDQVRVTYAPSTDPSYLLGTPDGPLWAIAPARGGAGWFHLTTAAIGGVTALGAEAAAAVPARRAVFGGDDSSPDSSRAAARATVRLN